MTQPTAQQLDEIQARHDAATAGPWGVYESGPVIEIAADLKETGCGYRARRGVCRLEDEPLDNDPTHREWTAEEDWAQVQADAKFIAHAPDDVNALLAEVHRLTAELADFSGRVNELESQLCDCQPTREHEDYKRPAFYQHESHCPVNAPTPARP
jgi:hypothetical protein